MEREELKQVYAYASILWDTFKPPTDKAKAVLQAQIWFDFLRDYSEIFKVQVVVDNVVKIEQSYSLSVDTIAFDIYLGGNAKLSFIKSYNPIVKG